MTNELLSSSQSLLGYMLVLSLQLLVILLLRKAIARRFGAITAYRLWALPLLWLPFHWIELPALNWSMLGRLLPSADSNVEGVVSWMPQSITTFNVDFTLPALALLSPENGWNTGFWLTGSILWLAIAMLLLLLQVMRIHQFSSALSALNTGKPQSFADESLPSSLKICYLQGLSSPALFGIFQPRLLLPTDFEQRFSARQRYLILKHETVHLQRHDNFWNLLASVFRIMFWFNPLLHIAWKRFRLDQELSCDERVLQDTHPDEGRQYARTLLETMGNGLQFRHQPTITAWGNLREIKERAHMIQHHIKHKPRHGAGKWLLLGCVLSGSIITALYNDDVNQVIAAEPEQRVANVLSREVYEVVARVQELRDQTDYAAALEELDVLKSLSQEGKLPPYEAFTMWQYYGSIEMDQGNYEQSIAYWQNALGIADTELGAQQSGLTHLVLGRLMFLQEHYNDAINSLLAYLELSPNPHNEVRKQIAQAYNHQENYPLALKYLQEFIHQGRLTGEPAGKDTYSFLQRLYLANDQEDEAEDVARIIASLPDESNSNPHEDIVPESVRISSNNYLPTKTVPPRYPTKALRNNVEGWALVEFTVNEKGEVVAPLVADVEPEGYYFEEMSLEAISKFKFNPKQEDGNPVVTENVRYVFTYTLNQ